MKRFSNRNYHYYYEKRVKTNGNEREWRLRLTGIDYRPYIVDLKRFRFVLRCFLVEEDIMNKALPDFIVFESKLREKRAKFEEKRVKYSAKSIYRENRLFFKRFCNILSVASLKISAFIITKCC